MILNTNVTLIGCCVHLMLKLWKYVCLLILGCWIHIIIFMTTPSKWKQITGMAAKTTAAQYICYKRSSVNETKWQHSMQRSSKNLLHVSPKNDLRGNISILGVNSSGAVVEWSGGVRCGSPMISKGCGGAGVAPAVRYHWWSRAPLVHYTLVIKSSDSFQLSARWCWRWAQQNKARLVAHTWPKKR